MDRIMNVFVYILLAISCIQPALSLPLDTSVYDASTSEVLPKGLKLRLLPLGDSITFGIGSSSSTSYRASLYKKLTDAGASATFIGSVRTGNFEQPNHEGHSGFTIAQISAVSDQSLAKKPNVITLMAGTNDMPRGDAKGAVARLGALIDKIFTAVPETVLLVATLTPLGFAQAAVDTFNNELPALVKARAAQGKKIAVVDLSGVKNSDIKDGVHPNDSGYEKMAVAFFKAVEDAAEKRWINEPVPT